MTNVDLYQQCPCGSGKKLKFCCGSDISHELEDIQRAIDGQQRAAALDLVQRALATKGARPALLMIQIQLSLGGQRFDLAEAAVRDLLKLRPKDAAAVSVKAMVLAQKGDVRGAVEALHDSVEMLKSDGEAPLQLAQAYGTIGAEMVSRAIVQAGIAHLAAASQLLQHQDPETFNALRRLNAARDIPMLSKELPPMADAPTAAAWKAEFDAAKSLGERGLWRKARNQFRMMAENLSQEPAVLKNLAIMQSLLGDPKATAAAWRVYARLPNLPLDEAVEAEAQALLADPGEPAEIPAVTLRYPIKNVDACMERLLSDRRCYNSPLDTSNWDAEDGPPPKAAFLLLDRELPASDPDIALADVPRLLGHLFVFGKQTDRPALLEAEFDKDDRFDARVQQLLAVAGDQLDAPLPEEVTATHDAASLALSLGLVFPRDVSSARQTQLAEQLRGELLADRWTRAPLWECGGKTAVEAAKDSKFKLPLLATLLLVESSFHQQGLEVDANRTREALGLPRAEPIVLAADDDAAEISAVRLARVDASRATDAQLDSLLKRAVTRGQRVAQRKLALEAVGRPSAQANGAALLGCELLASTARDLPEALDWIAKGRQIAATHSLPAGPIKILELEMRAIGGDFQTFGDLLREILEQDVPQSRETAYLLYNTMTRLGLVTPEGKFVVPTPRARANPLAGAPGAAGPGAPSAPAGIWTPGSGTPAAPAAAPAPAAKSKLWLPGMD